MVEKAPIVFRGREVTRVGPFRERVRIQVMRTYRGDPGAEVEIYVSPFSFSHPGAAFRGEHGADWLIFGERSKRRIELYNHCSSAVPVSPELAEDTTGADLIGRLEAEFRAGLRDSSQQGREISIQRLGGLDTPSARQALGEVLFTAGDRERFWAAHALLRTDSLSPAARDYALDAIATGLTDSSEVHRWTAQWAMSRFTESRQCRHGSTPGECLAWWANRRPGQDALGAGSGEPLPGTPR